MFTHRKVLIFENFVINCYSSSGAGLRWGRTGPWPAHDFDILFHLMNSMESVSLDKNWL